MKDHHKRAALTSSLELKDEDQDFNKRGQLIDLLASLVVAKYHMQKEEEQRESA